MSPPREIDHDSVELADLALFALSSWKRVTVWALVAAAAGAAISVQLPFQYQAQAQVLLPRGRSPLGSAVVGRAVALGAGLSGGYDMLSVMGDKVWERILRSRTAQDAILAQLHLEQVFRSKTPESARSKLNAALGTETKDGILRVTYLDLDPERAAAVANAAVDQLQLVYRQMETSQAHQRRLFLDQRLEQCGRDLAAAEEEARRLQCETRAIDPAEQGRATLSVSRELLSEYLRQTIELRVLEMAQQSRAPEATVARGRLDQIEKQLRSLEGSPSMSASAVTSWPSSATLPLAKLPDLKLTMARAERRIAMLTSLYAMLAGERERARIDEADDVEKLPVLDRAVAPRVRYSPSRTRWTLAFAFLGVLLGLMRACLAEWMRQLGQAPAGSAGAFLYGRLGRLGRWLGP
ncbi:MAG: hypothetical protein HY814_11295 [Candidatus Riflebacteria bacterium]|nr:hypothetical protein [Candidatus Riflebacteria bacterium]